MNGPIKALYQAVEEPDGRTHSCFRNRMMALTRCSISVQGARFRPELSVFLLLGWGQPTN